MSKPKIEVVQADAIEWMRVGDFAPNSSQQMLTSDNLDTKIKFLFASLDKLSLMEIVDVPNGLTDRHAHDQDEIFYILDGEMHFGSRILKTGDAIQIPKQTLYTYRAGSTGLRYLKFTAIFDITFIPEDEFRARQVEATA